MKMRGSDAEYLKLARRLQAEIESGQRAAGERLPGTRTLALQLSISRNTVLAAYNELIAQGWLETREARGTYVAADVPAKKVAPVSQSLQGSMDLGFALREARGLPSAEPAQEIRLRDFSSGLPDVRLAPAELIARSYRRVLRRDGAKLLGYCDSQGDLGLRKQVARLLAEERGVHVDPAQILITRGSQMALALVARLLIKPGERIAIERYGYRAAWDALKLAGAKLVPIPIDDQGMRVEKLANAGKLRAVYVTPHHQYPTMALMSPQRRAWLLDWAQRRRVAILEDDYDNEFHYHGHPVFPILSSDRSGVVCYVGGLSKVLAPALRLGYLVAPRLLVEQAARLRVAWDRQGDSVGEAAAAELLELGEVARHVRKMRRIYEERRKILAQALQVELGETLEFSLPPGGMSLWARIVDGTDPDQWSERAAKRGVRVWSAKHYDYRARSAPYLRLSFAAHTPMEIEDVVRVLRETH